MIETNWEKLAFPRLCGLIARQPTRLSQSMHNAGFRHLGLDFSYVAFDIEDTEYALDAVRRLGIRGLSLTIPHKEIALQHTDRLSDEVKAIGAMNTLLNSGDELFGFNTDCAGIDEALREAKFKVPGASIVVLGAGGAARAAVYTLIKESPKSIVVSNRSAGRGQALASDFGIEFCPLADIEEAISSCTLLINATPIGSHLGQGEHAFSLTCLAPEHCVFDFVTSETELTKKAAQQGAKVILGSRMLLFQALEQFKLFTELEAPREVLEQALMEGI